MGLFDEFLKNNSNEEIKSKIHILVGVMLADRQIHPSEEKLLIMIAKRSGVTEIELKKIINESMRNPSLIKFCPPTDRNEKVKYLLDMVTMMMADGKIDRREAALCETIAVKLGFNPVIIPEIVSHILKLIQQNAPRQQITTELDIFMEEK